MSSRERSDQILGGRRRFLRTGFVGAGLLGAHELSIHSADAFCWHKRRRVVACTPAPASGPMYAPQAPQVAPALPSARSVPSLTTGLCKSVWCPSVYLGQGGGFYNYTAVFCDPNGDPTTRTRGMSLTSPANEPLGCSPSSCSDCESSFMSPFAPPGADERGAKDQVMPAPHFFGAKGGKPLPEVGMPDFDTSDPAKRVKLPPADFLLQQSDPSNGLISYSNFRVNVRREREIRLMLFFVMPTTVAHKPYVIAFGREVEPQPGKAVPLLDPSQYGPSRFPFLIWVTPPGSKQAYSVMLAHD